MKKVLFMALCATVVAVSCEKVIENQEEVIKQEQAVSVANPVTRTFSMVFDHEPGTKLSIDGTGKTGWEKDDKILIHGEYINKSGHSVVVTLDGVTNTISADNQTAYITITTTEEDEATVDGCVRKYSRKEKGDYISSIYAIYPADAVASGEIRSYYYGVFKNTNAPISIGYDDGAGSFVFRNYCGIISFTMPKSEDFDYYEFSGKNGETVGYSNYVARHALGTTELKTDQGVTSSGLTTSGPLTAISGPVVCDGTTVNLICIPTPTSGGEKVVFDNGFTIKFIKDGVITKKVSTSSKVTVNRNDYIPLGNISGALKTYVDPHSPAGWTAGATDISGGGETANCYTLAKTDVGNVYKIPAVKGNDKLQTLTPSGAQILWETYNDNTAPASINIVENVDYDSDYIYFQLADPLVAGNALIAAKNALDEVIWSWHIWVPDDDIDSGTYNLSNSSREIMDRNLGALVIAGSGDVKANGLMYQWGRKDPFLGIGAQGSSTIATMTGDGAKAWSDGALDVAASIKNPTMFILSTGSASNHDWVKTNDTSLWGTSKTIYDPCPAGWMVPAQADLTVFNTNAHEIMSEVAGWYDSANYCATVKGTVFPLTGVLQYNDGNNEYYGTRTGVWSSTTADWADGCAVWMDIKSGPTSTHSGERKGRAASVRCIEISHP